MGIVKKYGRAFNAILIFKVHFEQRKVKFVI